MRSCPNRGPSQISQARSRGNSQLMRILTEIEFFENGKASSDQRFWEGETPTEPYLSVLGAGLGFLQEFFLGLNPREST